MDHPWIQVAMRYLHIVSAVAAVGGMAAILFCLSPALRLLDEAARESVLRVTLDRFTRLLWAAIVGLTLSGVYNWYMLAEVYRRLGPKGNALIGTKVLLALIMFAVVFARGAGLIRPQSPRTVLLLNLHLGAVVILLGSILRYLRMHMG